MAKDLEPLAESTSNTGLRDFCLALKEHYSYPVDTILLTPELEVIDQLGANQAMGGAFRGYVPMLEKAVEPDGRDPTDDEAR